MNSMRGSSSWKKEVPLIAKHFVKQKLRSRKEYRNTYNRIRRGERAFTDADLRNGRIIQQGREEIKNKYMIDRVDAEFRPVEDDENDSEFGKSADNPFEN